MNPLSFGRAHLVYPAEQRDTDHDSIALAEAA